MYVAIANPFEKSRLVVTSVVPSSSTRWRCIRMQDEDRSVLQAAGCSEEWREADLEQVALHVAKF